VALTHDDAVAFEQCVTAGGVVLFGADTVYGLACDGGNPDAVRRVYELKGRPPDKPAALMAFSMPVAEVLLARSGTRTRAAARALLPGAVTLVLPQLGMRYPALSEDLQALSAIGVPVMQTSANLAGGPEAKTLGEVVPEILEGADLVLDCGPLAGLASTVIDLRQFENSGVWGILREGAVDRASIERVLS
jgi:L-threonylcarbamoyladenylate synthase